MTKYLVLSMDDAENHRLVACACGHSHADHLEHNPEPCDYCSCCNYRPTTTHESRGRLIDVPAIVEADIIEAIQETANG